MFSHFFDQNKDKKISFYFNEKDIGGEPNQVFMNQATPSTADHYLENPTTSAASGMHF